MNGAIYVGTSFGGLYRFDPLAKTFEQFYNPLEPNGEWIDDVNGVLYDSNGDMWIGSATGILRISPEDGSTTNYTDVGNINSIEEDAQGNLWFTSWDGLYRYDRNTNSFTHFQHGLDIFFWTES